MNGKKVLVVGLGRSGMAAVKLLRSHGAIVTANDFSPESKLSQEVKELRSLGIEPQLGTHPEDLFINAELIVVSPGVPADIPALEAARRRGIDIVSEVELAGWFLKGRLIGITGSNGKTTTTTLTGDLMKAAGADVLVGGNIGTPIASLVPRSHDDCWTVAELSSFQLEAVRDLRVNVAVVTNITPDHLDRHRSFEDYVAAKKRIFLNQTESDWAVLNGTDPTVVKVADNGQAGQARSVFFSSTGRRISCGEASIYLRDSRIWTTLPGHGRETEVMPIGDIPLRGMHNVENVMAAVGATLCATQECDDRIARLRDAIKEFKGVEHRIEFVAEIDGVTFYNDSKATNVDSTRKALEAFDRNVILILGGKDKGSDYSILAPLITERVKHIVLIGAASDKIADQLRGAAPMAQSGSMGEAVRISMEAAQPGDTVLLAPACASFDMFRNYEHRGRVFKEEVGRLAKCDDTRD